MAALRDVDRLVLLGDVVELREGPLGDALAGASRVLTDVGRAMGAGCEIVLVPGNHDHHLLSAWAARRAAAAPAPPLGLDAEVDWRDGEPLGVLAGALSAGGARVTARYPGVWLREDTYASHGHYLDRHTTVPLFERVSAGATARLLGRPLSAISAAEDYEAVMAPGYAWIHAVAQTRAAGAPAASVQVWDALGRGRRDGLGVRGRALHVGLGGGIALLNRLGLGPLRADVSVSELRRAGLRAFAEVLRTLSVRSRYAVFGHTHRAGPLPSDDPWEWRTAAGTQLLNSGCWVDELASGGRRDSPYRPGFAVRLDADAPPELVNLLG